MVIFHSYVSLPEGKWVVRHLACQVQLPYDSGVLGALGDHQRRRRGADREVRRTAAAAAVLHDGAAVAVMGAGADGSRDVDLGVFHGKPGKTLENSWFVRDLG